MEYYSNIVQAVDGLKADGYIEDFNLKQNCIECMNGDYEVFHNEFDIDKYYRFTGNTYPIDESIIYAVSSAKYNLKGVLLNGYGISFDALTDEMFEKLK